MVLLRLDDEKNESKYNRRGQFSRSLNIADMFYLYPFFFVVVVFCQCLSGPTSCLKCE